MRLSKFEVMLDVKPVLIFFAGLKKTIRQGETEMMTKNEAGKNNKENGGVKMKYLWILTLLAMPGLAMAAPDVKVEITAEKVIYVEKGDKQVEKLVAAEDVLPGDVLVYSLHYENKGDQSATGVALKDPVPANTVYVAGSAFGPGADIEFSIDGGKTYKKPSLLSYEVNVAGKQIKRAASPEEYTHIRWTVSKVDAGKSGVAGFRVRVN